jgi:Na+/H+ antiporter NhaD/arsenite permease-like protein
MQAPLQMLNTEGKNIVTAARAATGLSKEQLFFWSTGSLSSVLDNAPTYVVFFETAKSLSPNSEAELEADVHDDGSPKWAKDAGQWRSVEEWKNDEHGELKPVFGKAKLVPVNNGFVEHFLLMAVSLGAVFMGAMTYIGNGPNFMIKAIAEQDGVKMPSFFGYMVYSCLILLPLLVIMTILFL